MTTPYRRGSEPGASGNPLEEFFPDFPTPWNNQWVLQAGAAAADDNEEVLVGRNMVLGASGILGATGGATGASGTPVTVKNKSSMPSLHQRDQNVVTAVYQGAVPMLGAWEGASEALSRLLGGFSSLEQFIETLVKVLTGAEVDLSFITDGARILLELLEEIFGPIGRIFTAVWETIGEDIFQAIVDFLGWVWNLFSEIAADLGEDVRPILEAVTNVVKTLWEVFGDVIEAILQPLSDFLKWLFETFGDVVEDFLKPVLSWIFGIWNAIGAPLLSDIAAFLASVWDTIGEPALLGIFGVLSTLWNTFDEVVIDNLVTFFVNLTEGNLLGALEDVGDFFKGIIDSFGSIGAGLFNGLPTFADLTEAANDIFDTAGAWVLGIINGLTGGLFSAITEALGAVIEWASGLFLIGPALQALIPESWRNVTAQPASSVADLKEYAAETLNTSSVLYSGNLQGPIPADLFPVISPGLVGETIPNLVADGGFRAATAVQSGEGWSWDATQSRTVGDGGSAKVTGDGGVKQMFSNMIAVSPGQSLQCSVYAKWTKPSAARPTIGVGLRTYNGDTVISTFNVASQASVVSNSSGWVLISGTYDIPASIPMTNARLVLSVLNAPSGTSVWFDEAALKKVSLIDQKYVAGVGINSSNLADDIENAVGTEQYNDLLRAISRKTGYTLADVQATVEDFLDGDSTISGDQIKAGNIASTYINELGDTWDKVHQGVTGNLPAATGTLDSAFSALANWREVVTGASSGSQQAKDAILAVNNRMDILNKEFGEWKIYVGKLQTDVNSALTKLALPPTAGNPPSAPVDNFASYSDTFDRASLGSGWSVGYRIGNYGALATNGRHALFDVPDFGQYNVCSAIYTGGNSKTEYQRVYTTLGTAPGRPLLGTVGYNDLIARAASGTVCIVARFYGDAAKTIKLFYRNGAYESDPFNPANTFATFTGPSEITSGTVLELYAGNKAVSDQTKCYVKVGSSWASNSYTMNAAVLSVMGRGWGFGIGNGLSFLVAQEGGNVDLWGGQDQ